MKLVRLIAVLSGIVIASALVARSQTYPARGLDYNQLDGGSVGATSELTGYPAASAFQGDRVGQNCAFVTSASRCWGKDGGWADSTPGTFPDSLWKTWASPHSVSRFVVSTFQDNFSTPRVEPYVYLRVGADYTIEDFDVQILTADNSWLTVATITENYFIIREVNVPAITAKGCKLVIHDSVADYSRVVSFEAYGR